MGNAYASNPQYLIDTNHWYWMHSEWFSVGVLFVNVIVGALGGAVFYLNYVVLKEILMIFPYDYI